MARRVMCSRALALRDGGIFFVIDMDGRVDHESPPGQDGDVDWPLRCVADDDNPEHHNHKQKGDCGPA